MLFSYLNSAVSFSSQLFSSTYLEPTDCRSVRHLRSLTKIAEHIHILLYTILVSSINLFVSLIYRLNSVNFEIFAYGTGTLF